MDLDDTQPKCHSEEAKLSPRGTDRAENYGVSQDQMKTYVDEFRKIDKDKDGHISAQELQFAMVGLNVPVSLAQADKMVKMADSNIDGKLDLEEFLTVLIRTSNLQKHMQMEEEAMKVFRAFDVNGDGVISVDELRQALAKLGEIMTKKEAAKLLKSFDRNGDGQICYTEFLDSYKVFFE